MSHTTYLDDARTLAVIHDGDFGGPIELVSAKFGPSDPQTIQTTYNEMENLIIEKNRCDIIAFVEQITDLDQLMQFKTMVNTQRSIPRGYQAEDN